MVEVRLCVFLLILFVQHQTTSAKPSLWSDLFEMFSNCDSTDWDDDSSDSDSDDTKSDTSQSSDAKPIFNLTLPPSKNGLSVVVEKLNGQVAVNVNSVGDSKSGDGGATTAATTAAAATTTAEPTTTAKA